MANRLNISFDSDMLESISAEFDLRAPNKHCASWSSLSTVTMTRP